MALQLRPYQLDGLEAIWKEIFTQNTALCVLPTGAGKCLGRGTPVMMFDGTIRAVELIQVGDKIMGPDSQPRTVGALGNGTSDLFKITPNKGDSFVCNGPHILSLMHTETSEIVHISVYDWIEKSKYWQHCHKLYRSPISFSGQWLSKLTPYFVGIWLGDGSRGTVSITKSDPEIIAAVQFECGRHGLRIVSDTDRRTGCITTSCRRINGVHGKSNPMAILLKDFGFQEQKRVPHWALTSDETSRKELLAGLLDTDGHLSKSGFQFSSVLPELASAVVFLSRSLGLAAYISIKVVNNKQYRTVSISGDLSIVPTRISRKISQKRLQKKSVLRTGFKVEQLPSGEYFGFEIDGDKRFLLGDFTVTHNTEIMIGFLKKCLEVKPDFKAAILMGRIDLVAQTERRFRAALDPRLIGVWCGSMNRREYERAITVASVQSADVKKFPTLNLVIIDEVHRLDQKEGGFLRFVNHSMDVNPKCKLVGFTATPFRADGEIFGDKQIFKRVCFRRTIQEMIALGFLVPPVLKASKNEFDTSQLRIRAGEYAQEDVNALVADQNLCRAQVIDAIYRLESRECIAWATANIEHCNLVANELMKLGQGVTTVHSKLSTSNRNANLSAFMTGQVRHMVFVTVLSEGWDHPPVDSIVLMRPTRSPVLYVQTVGRGLRPYRGKKNCLVLDYGQVVQTLGPLDSPNVKGKTGRDKPAKPANEGLKCCPACLTFMPFGTAVCPECNYQFPPPEKPEEKLDKKAAEHQKILSEKAMPEKENLGPIVISMYEAKSGNLCVRVHYQDRKTIFHWGGIGGISEYFSIASHWAMERLERRLQDLNVSLPGIPFKDEVTVDGVFEVTKIKDGRYDRVLSVKKSIPDPLGGWGEIINESRLGEGT